MGFTGGISEWLCDDGQLMNARIKCSPTGARILCTSAQPKTPPASSIRPPRRHRFPPECATRSRDVPVDTAERHCPNLPWPPLESSPPKSAPKRKNLGIPESGQRNGRLSRQSVLSGFLKMLSDRPGPGLGRCRSISTMLETAMSPHPSMAHCREAVLIMVVVCLAGANNESAPSKCFCLDRGWRP